MDRCGEQSLDYNRFTMSWFQLADQFTEQITAEAYVAYLRSMFKKMVEIDEVTGAPVWKDQKVIAGIEKGSGIEYNPEMQKTSSKMKGRRMSISMGSIDSGVSAVAPLPSNGAPGSTAAFAPKNDVRRKSVLEQQIDILKLQQTPIHAAPETHTLVPLAENEASTKPQVKKRQGK